MHFWFRLFAVCCCLFTFREQARASHVVGGDLTYKHIINDSFEVTLTLYIDCINGIPAAIAQDADAMLGIFDTSGTLIRTMLENRSLPTRINSVSLDCVLPPANACVDKYTYTFNTTFAYRPGGYYLAYQRCCRNNTIKNIIQPQSTGATFWCYVPDSAWLNGYNSAAVFKTLPPNYLCANRAFSYDHSAADADGDSLVYELYTPYLGGGTGNTLPRPPGGPPYQPVSWIGSYNEQQMMLGNPELTIHPKTGQINVTPTATGQYVVGIAVKEYRNGKWINTTRRDFQFNVFNCVVSIVSSFVKDIKACSDTIQFTNSSAGATTYFWDFGDTTKLSDTSSVFEPVYIYGRTGTFRIKLFARDGNCVDSSEATVFIDSDKGAFAIPDTIICPGDSIKIGSNDSIGFSYVWQLGLYLDSPFISNPTSRPPRSYQYTVTRTSELCVNVDTVKITLKDLNPEFSVSLVNGCKDATLLVTPAVPYPTQLWKISDTLFSKQQLEVYKLAYNRQVGVKLIVSDNQCWDSLVKYIKPVFVDSFTTVPNVFSPNDDGINDCYRIEHISLATDCSRLKVYNRWGTLLFDSDENGECWDGKSNGAVVSEGVYFYILTHRSKDYHGTIKLIR
ncbi:MAG: gliding motility-associated C-terminal domain-containing protein [Bacteroidota bacterium]